MLKQIKDSGKIEQLKERYPSVNVIVIILAIIMLWRGIWGLLDTYVFPGSPTFSNLFCIVLGVVILYLDGFSIDNLKR